MDWIEQICKDETPGQILFTRNEVFMAIARIMKSVEELPEDAVFISVLKGGDYLARKICGTNVLYSIEANSYVNNKKLPNNELNINVDGCLSHLNLIDRTVVLIDDIYDSGNTLKQLNELLLKRGAKEVKNIVLVKRTGWHHFDVDIYAFGFEVTSEDFLVGCGMDYNGQYRDTPYITVIEKDNSYKEEYVDKLFQEKDIYRLLKEASCPKCGECNWEQIGEVICQPGTEGSRRHCDEMNLKPCPWCIERKERLERAIG
jgi:hypoxanthine phosphoribosyltransferase